MCEAKTHRTKDWPDPHREEIDALATEIEEIDHDVETLKARRAEADQTTTSEIIREALR